MTLLNRYSFAQVKQTRRNIETTCFANEHSALNDVNSITYALLVFPVNIHFYDSMTIDHWKQV